MTKEPKKEIRTIKKGLTGWVANYGNIWVKGDSELDVKEKIKQKIKEQEQEQEYFIMDWGK